MKSLKRGCRGFSVLEILIVIGIIGLLAAAVIASLNQARKNAKAVTILSDFRQIENAIHLLGGDKAWKQWPFEGAGPSPSFGYAAGDPPIEWLIANQGLGSSLTSSRQVDGQSYKYDNDNDIYLTDASGCATGDIDDGVNLFLTIADQDIFTRIDSIMDDGDGNTCGRARLTGANVMIYELAKDYTHF
ncbi:MAG: hypothetical protein G01um101433_112 [Parcubacteria group bacterium Gr01-1014_33]|nr:MAG: hypothetical protein G01um101433_112 [Parcubacteria group bacterium Gr01-1014_33]